MAYLVLFVFIIYCIYATIHNAKYLKKVHIFKSMYGYNYDSCDIKYDSNYEIIKVVLITLLVGILGGLIGLAGGVILNPVFLGMGLHPTVVASTN